ncbi:MAG: hypothetical protein F7B20_01070 [Aeropyrum sp.]|nr:hypothetical protein [Aeropyrum sp.]
MTGNLAFYKLPTALLVPLLILTPLASTEANALSVSLSQLIMVEGGTYELIINDNVLVYSVNIYLEGLTLAERPVGKNGPLTLRFFLPDYLSGGDYTMFIRIVYFDGSSLAVQDIELDVTILDRLDVNIAFSCPEVVAVGETYYCFLYTFSGSQLADVNLISARLYKAGDTGQTPLGPLEVVYDGTGVYVLKLQVNEPGSYSIVARTLEKTSLEDYARFEDSAGVHSFIAVEVLSLSDLANMIEDLDRSLGARLDEISSGVSEIQGDVDQLLSSVESAVEVLNRIDGNVAVIISDDGPIISRIVDVNNRIIILDNRARAIAADVASVLEEVQAVRGDVAVIKSDTSTILLKIEDLIERVDSISNNLVVIDSKLGQITGEVVAIKEGLAIIDTGVGQIELDLTALGAAIESLNGETATIKTQVGNITVGVDKLIQGMEVIDSRTVEIATGLGELDARIVEINDNIAVLETSVGEVEVRISEVQSGLEELRSLVESEASLTSRVLEKVNAILEELGMQDDTVETASIALGSSLISASIAAAAVYLLFRRGGI